MGTLFYVRNSVLWTYDESVATTAGTSVTLTTSIPSNAIDVEVMLNGVSTDTQNDAPVMQMGDAGGVETSGYISAVMGGYGAPTGTFDTNHFQSLRNTNFEIGDLVSGIYRLTRYDPSSHLWIVEGQFNEQTGRYAFLSGTKTMSQALTTIVLTTEEGTADFDAGSARVRWR